MSRASLTTTPEKPSLRAADRAGHSDSLLPGGPIQLPHQDVGCHDNPAPRFNAAANGSSSRGATRRGNG